VLTILPNTIDTPDNRKAMPDADFSKWENPDQVASILKMWASGENVPISGSFLKLKVHKGSVSYENATKD